MLDILLFQQRYENVINWEYVRRSVEDVKIERFWADLIVIGNRYLGFSLSSFYEEVCPDELLQELLYCGIFGKGDATMDAASKMAGAALTGREDISIIRKWLKAMFPNKKYFTDHQIELEEKPWLIVRMWCYRWWKFIKRNAQHGIGMTINALKRTKKRLRLIKNYDSNN